MKICIPSHRRSFLINKKTLAQIPKRLRKDVIVFCTRDEYDTYRSVLPSDIELVGTDAVGIARTRQFIGHHCEKMGADTFVMLDDDLKFIRRKDPSDTALIDVNEDDMSQMFAAIRRMLSYHVHVGVSARQGNNNVGVGSADILIERNTRLLRVLAYRVKDFLKLEHGRVDIMEDFDITLQLLRKGLSNVNLYWWAQDQAQTQAPGGCSEYRTQEVHANSARKLAELHSSFVSLVQKKNKTGGEFGNRLEVRIQWKAAFEEGRIRNVSSSGGLDQRAV